MLDTTPDTLIVPLIIATTFTVGGVLIQKLERHAESIAVVLGMVFILVTMFDVLAVSQRWSAENTRHALQSTNNGSVALKKAVFAFDRDRPVIGSFD